MKTHFSLFFCLFLSLCPLLQAEGFRPPTVPLVVVDSYFSIWSPANHLTDTETVHWTGKNHPLHLLVRIDGKPYRLMGLDPTAAEAMPQTSVEISPLRTKYVFQNAAAQIDVTFITPVVPTDLDALSRPVTYLTVAFSAKDGKKHDTDFYFDAGGEIAVNNPNESVIKPVTVNVPGTKTMKFGTKEQPVLAKKGDNIRIDWGYFILSVPKTSDLSARNGKTARTEFIETGKLSTPLEPANAETYPVDKTGIVLAAVSQKKGTADFGETFAVLAYDDVESIRYFAEDLPAWWKRNGKTAEAMLEESWAIIESDTARKIWDEFETGFVRDLEAVGGKDYAQLCALAYRQVLGSQKIVADVNGQPLMFSKENFSNGCIGTVDLMYPQGPMLLYYSPALVKATLQPILDYAASEQWKFPFAPHDIGTYPHATGQVYGGGERTETDQMPVEESANILLLVAALAVAEQKTDYTKQHWKTLTVWAEYLLDKGFDPENQLCTDDFAGHLAHNVNLSAKAIVALGAYAQLAEKLGKTETAKKYRKAAEDFAARWIKEADDGGHFRLAFDKPGTWSMKYNLMWDTLLGLKLFPASVMEKEIAYYKKVTGPFGLPLDNRSLYTKNDWILWTATMTTNREDFDALVKPVVRFVNETPDRVPLSDWYWTDSAKQRGFQNRCVIGGFWSPMLKNREKWQEQAGKGANLDDSKPWAKILLPGKTVKTIVPTALEVKTEWSYTTAKLADGWEKPEFDDSGWKTGQAGFGTRNTPGAIPGTNWDSSDIYLRRTFEWDGEVTAGTELQLLVHHDDDVQIYLNGKLVLSRSGYVSDYMPMPSKNLTEVLKKGKNTFAVYCHQDHGGQYIDVGISAVEKTKR